ncbi:helix-turn-helix transcriptional regulator [Actinomadura violacea]|uniref:Helix-turn-helix domain-containing protein n=1 Tax=Actinomadura violacea TaxID=2819934 RepID=A0ABS3RMY2_9ACTN|nr:helix-turn-helix transcriptional regulator [Actinomadura violacea]MBO2457971.1 helix-turn-helix domain-containing protein [Actinomadura violacea]
MDSRNEVRDFLASRRARITPRQAGLPAYGGNRRVPGLRREEVAMLAGVSVDYYIRLERGNLSGVSDSVLEALVRALQLDDAERAHLFDLARAAGTGQRVRRPAPKVRPGLQRMLDAMTDAPSIIRNGRMDILAANRLGRAMYWPVFQSPRPSAGRGGERPPNIARFQFLDPAGPGFFPDWNTAADITVALMRTEAGRDPYDRELTDLIGELCTRSDDFRTRWARHNVRRHHAGTKTFHHPAVGDLTLDYESIDLVADGDLNLTVYTATPDSSSHDAVRLLASWAATLDDEAAALPDGAPRDEPADRSPDRTRPER